MNLDTLFNIRLTNSLSSKEALNAAVELDPSHDIFKGHFPGSPVLPGVCMIHIIKSVLEKHFERKLNLISAQTIKFNLPVNPLENSLLDIEIVFKKDTDAIDISANVTAPDKKFCSFRGIFS